MDVKWLKTVAVFGFLACWLAASNHCRLEFIPWLSFLACCEQGDGLPTQDKDCETDGCAAVEGNFYKSEDSQPSISAPVVAGALFLIVALDDRLQSFSHPPDCSSLAPPELPVTWQFSCRAAAPPRAPSPVS